MSRLLRRTVTPIRQIRLGHARPPAPLRVDHNAVDCEGHHPFGVMTVFGAARQGWRHHDRSDREGCRGMSSLVTYQDGEPFPGVIGRTSDESSPAWPTPPRAPEGAPNVVIFVLDDVGFGQLSCFGGLVETPVLDRFADNGLRYTNMHTTALCSPSRGAILTGRNHHSLGLATISETSTGYPGYNAILPFDKGMLSEMLLPHGYNTFLVGKWHLSPPEHETAGRAVRPLAAGPRVRAVLRLPRRRHQPVVPRAGLRQPLGRAAGAARGRLPPERRPGRPGDRVHPGRPRQRAGQAVLPALLHRRRPRAAPRRRRSGPTSTRASSTPAGTSTARWSTSASSRWASSRPAPSCPRTTPTSRVGHAARGCPEGLRPDDGGLRRVRQLHRPRVRPGGQTSSRRSASSTTRCSCSSPTTAPAPRADRSGRSTR